MSFSRAPRKNSALETEMLVSTLMSKGNFIDTVKYNAQRYAATEVVNRAKNAFGIELDIGARSTTVNAVTNWIAKHDAGFKKHIANPQLLLDTTSKETPIFNNNFAFKVDKYTWIYVHPYTGYDGEYGFSMYIFGKHSPKYYKVISKLIKEQTNVNHAMYSIMGYGGDREGSSHWSCTGSTYFPRPMDTVFLNQGKKEAIIDHLNNWLSNESVYIDRGLIFKTGILLYGKPGTGKSSMANAIATYLGCNMIVIDSTTFQHMDIPSIVQSINADEDRYVILIDEIDTIFVSRDNADSTEVEKEKTSKLLSLLDSTQSPTNVVFVATTNYIDRLDDAVRRKGRFDLAVELADINKATALQMCKSFNITDEQADKLLAQYPDHDKINPAELQAKILEVVKKHEA